MAVRSILGTIPGVRPDDRLVFLDLEGAEPNYVSAVAAVVCDLAGNPTACKETLVNPGDVEWFESIIRLTGIRPEMVRDKPSFDMVWEEWLGELLSGPSIVVCHDVYSDMTRLNRDCARYGIKMPQVRFMDTLELSRDCIPSYLTRSNRLSDACRAMKIATPKAHKADADAEMCRRLFRELLRTRPLPFSQHEIMTFAPSENPNIICVERGEDANDSAPKAQVEHVCFEDVFDASDVASGTVRVSGENVLLKGAFDLDKLDLMDRIEDLGGSVDTASSPSIDTTLVVIGAGGYVNRGARAIVERLRDNVERLNTQGASIRVVPEWSLMLS